MKKVSSIVLVAVCLIAFVISGRGSLTFTNTSGYSIDRVTITIDVVEVEQVEQLQPGATLPVRFSASDAKTIEITCESGDSFFVRGTVSTGRFAAIGVHLNESGHLVFDTRFETGVTTFGNWDVAQLPQGSTKTPR